MSEVAAHPSLLAAIAKSPFPQRYSWIGGITESAQDERGPALVLIPVQPSMLPATSSGWMPMLLQDARDVLELKGLKVQRVSFLDSTDGRRIERLTIGHFKPVVLPTTPPITVQYTEFTLRVIAPN